MILSGIVPEENALWVLGCESITPDDLERFKEEVRDACVAVNEPYSTSPSNGEFIDPVVLLFWTKDAEEINKLVALVQFKTYPSRDEVFLEERALKKGSQIYRFRGKSGHLSAAAVICSDAFLLSGGVINDLIDRSTLIHIQLNPNPRNSAYRLYRSMTFQTNPKTSDCHIICLNWAQSIMQHGNGGTTEAWEDISPAQLGIVPKTGAQPLTLSLYQTIKTACTIRVSKRNVVTHSCLITMRRCLN